MFTAQKILKNGFTLIELLIVISVISVLAGVTISIIDPIKQRDKARDAVLKENLSKIGLVTNGYMSAYGVVPEAMSFYSGLSSAVIPDMNACTKNSYTCTFFLSGMSNPSTCNSSNGYSGNGGASCFYYYYASTSNNRFYIYVKSFSDTNAVFIYDSYDGKVKTCSSDSYNDKLINCQ